MKNFEERIDYEKAVKNAILDFEKKRDSSCSLKISDWIRENKPLLITAGAITTGAAKAFAWIIEHIDQIKDIFELFSTTTRSNISIKIIELNSISVLNEKLEKALNYDKLLIQEIVKQMEREFVNIKIVSDKYGIN